MSKNKSEALDTLTIERLTTQAYIGVHPWEKEHAQTIHIDLQLYFDSRRSAETDSLEDTVNYSDIAKRTLLLVKEKKFNLIETLAEEIARLSLEFAAIDQVTVTLHKPGAIRLAKNVSITITRP